MILPGWIPVLFKFLRGKASEITNIINRGEIVQQRPFTEPHKRPPVQSIPEGGVGHKYGGVGGPIIKQPPTGPLVSPGEGKKIKEDKKKIFRM